jgi:hypothetical protein
MSRGDCTRDAPHAPGRDMTRAGRAVNRRREPSNSSRVDQEPDHRSRRELFLVARGRPKDLDHLPAGQPQDRDVALPRLLLNTQHVAEARDGTLEVVRGHAYSDQSFGAHVFSLPMLRVGHGRGYLLRSWRFSRP